jgi:hypothetical protein
MASQYDSDFIRDLKERTIMPKKTLAERIAALEAKQAENGSPVSKESIGDFLAQALEAHPDIVHIWTDDNHLGPLGGRSCQVTAAFGSDNGFVGVIFNVYSEPAITEKVEALIDETAEEVATQEKRREILDSLPLRTKTRRQPRATD